MPTKTATLMAPAKINLHLRILGLRQDGYHELRTLFHPVSTLCDTLAVEPGPDGDFYLRCPDNPALEGPSNLVYRAWKAYGEATGFQPGLFVTLTKRIPMGGGLGGGSSDAAAMLRHLQSLAADRALAPDRLNAMAARLGADVPFFLMDGPAMAEGIGERLTPAPVNLSGLTLVLACPDIHVDTAWAFRAFDTAARLEPREFLTTSALNTKNASPVSPLPIVNDFEPVVFQAHPRLREIKEKLIRDRASAAAMSGSGASLFGLFRDRGVGVSAARALEREGVSVHLQTL
ncbi:MAG: 4-(cytidine 5'-diphospho)-2-C-methyl-D-erythritol kinase [Pseudodesulfovibrio sp.]|uniref:4-diphosphocytidyl-2-C-methyl-D-erythritol kinase n=1 Tax=Pseudodesulfovibrio aespoeensis (strain ATCC 700646 / DSM 10631 / Aspo-2) TaxID=643562 RepID=E6VRW5_PSEA9|nr:MULTISPECIES: 4-(cytidine 5'-diphospho)-2-C-methyl-D-erythritol kinase [Pseudodesulfovibrio]MBU4192976.1 4-(cytidine 5'-diphospho)-2-C-methyl-D-erythritol kinase [Pseudomonadota bacterium]ADU61898.1 4-diphosphocytidyl-2C-methyl-D-erythritol kinase [Pseudodesulfovibrio aespoeensis Aspo-2]MBU4244274.1 4-(cytidine 5'-diphospho)-2-C-methyl-D-erythritol kinase [Pseudomonadota bacterium]MBU4379362.1 4-(cytidine 5'-diphospho)-2-C-methyl-D-erythritol kinase [Pseudomonadota bacterium]MBU4476385.1 4-